MNLLLVVPWDQEFGGVASVVGNLAIQLKNRGHRVLFFNPGESDILDCRMTTWNFTGYRLSLRQPPESSTPIKARLSFCVHFIPTLWKLYQLIEHHRISIVNIHYPSPQFVYFAIMKKLLQFRLVLSVHGADLFPEGRKSESYSKSFRVLMGMADMIVTPSEYMLMEVLHVFPSVSGRSTCIHNAVNLDEFEQDKSVPPRRYILCIAHLAVKKAVDVLIRSFASLGESEPDVELWLVGDGPLRGELEALVRNLRIESRVRFWGFQNRDQVRRFMSDSLFLVLPSRSEPFGIVLLEAMANRKAVIATAVGGIPEFVSNGKNGLLVPPDNPIEMAKAIMHLLQDESARCRLGQCGYETVCNRFQWRHAAEKYETVLAGLSIPVQSVNEVVKPEQKRRMA